MRVKLFENLARDHVGDGKRPNLYFVSIDGVINAIFSDRADAIKFAKTFGEVAVILVEDRLMGTVWGNRKFELQQSVPD